MDRTSIGIAIIILLGLFFMFGGGGPVLVEENGTLVGSQNTHNFIEGTNVTLDVVNDTGNGEIDITINAASGGVDLVDDGDGITATTSTESGLELLAGELSILRGCADGEIVKWTLASEDWGCSPDTGGAGGGDAIQVEDGDNLGTFTAIDTTARFEDQSDINFVFADGGAGGPDTVTALVRANSVGLATDTTGNFVATIVDAGNSNITVVGSGAENAAITLDVVDVTCTDCLGATEISDIYLLNSGDTTTGNIVFDDGVGDSPSISFTPATGVTFSVSVEDVTDDLLFEVNSASNETVDFSNFGAGNFDIISDGVIQGTSFTGGNVTSGADPGHTHTGTSVSGLDISDDTNLVAGTNITLVDDTLNVDDAFLLNTGDIGTGVFDFGGATSFEMVNGVSPTVDADGEIAHDTTTDQIIIGADADVISTVRELSFALEFPLDADRFIFRNLKGFGVTVTDIECIVDPADAAESVVIALYEATATGDFTDLATNGLDGATTITCDNDGANDDGTLSNGLIDKDDWMGIDVGTVTGTVKWLTVAWVEMITRE